ncbi:S-adenosyl-L-methionine-dependent methyltransferase family protein [Lyngbya aestuarii BL J]|uniref:S-adenosyl-L-methionine-dependent methyltransferase family protein n=2 Tax=Lyngbya aestuarii TaxID=118322 RepID=U7QQQ4_9CYAN|nr:S-adenosyl-L-methionine-dependent methyltransferase family protein [Lyngbya aestuarii BL J]
MSWVLYHPQQGYYATPPTRIGASGDFFTAPHLGKDFGELLAEQLVEMWEVLHQPQPFTLVEMGAGQGILAADILQYIQQRYPHCFNAVDYIIIEKSAALKAEQQQKLSDQIGSSVSVRWCEWDDIPNDSITGCFFSNELVDALPVHQVVVRNRQLREIYVSLNTHSEGNNSINAYFTEIEADLSTPQLQTYFETLKIDLFSDIYSDGYRTEINLAALDWMTTVTNKLQQGFVLTIDYGYSAERYYSPTRASGTLQCYYQHRHHNNPYIHIGQQDITAHVDFTALEKQGELLGLEVIGFTQQALFLMALGLGDRIAAISQTQGQNLSEVLRRREALHSLINPMGLGNFGVLIQSKGLATENPIQLKGLTIPTL